MMKTQKLFIIWDETKGYLPRVYLDRKSADIALSVLYTEYWINNGKVVAKEIKGISYV